MTRILSIDNLTIFRQNQLITILKVDAEIIMMYFIFHFTSRAMIRWIIYRFMDRLVQTSKRIDFWVSATNKRRDVGRSITSFSRREYNVLR